MYTDDVESLRCVLPIQNSCDLIAVIIVVVHVYAAFPSCFGEYGITFAFGKGLTIVIGSISVQILPETFFRRIGVLCFTYSYKFAVGTFTNRYAFKFGLAIIVC